MARDIVCGMGVSDKTAIKSFYNAETFYFCSINCKNTFEKDPRRFIKR